MRLAVTPFLSFTEIWGSSKGAEGQIPGRLYLRPELWDSSKAWLLASVFVASSCHLRAVTWF